MCTVTCIEILDFTVNVSPTLYFSYYVIFSNVPCDAVTEETSKGQYCKHHGEYNVLAKMVVFKCIVV